MKVCPAQPKHNSVNTVRKYLRKKRKAAVGGSISELNKPSMSLRCIYTPRS